MDEKLVVARTRGLQMISLSFIIAAIMFLAAILFIKSNIQITNLKAAKLSAKPWNGEHLSLFSNGIILFSVMAYFVGGFGQRKILSYYAKKNKVLVFDNLQTALMFRLLLSELFALMGGIIFLLSPNTDEINSHLYVNFIPFLLFAVVVFKSFPSVKIILPLIDEFRDTAKREASFSQSDKQRKFYSR